MLLSLLLLASSCLTSTSVAQTITSVLAGNAELSTLYSHVQNIPDFSAYLDKLTDITFLAPSNDALTTFLSSPTGTAASQDSTLLQAILTYHVQEGTWYEPINKPGTGFPHFVRTELSSPKYTNVTDGQFLEGVHDITGAGLIYSGLGDTSKIITPNLNITNGLVHVIDTVLKIPQDIATTAVAADLTAAIGAFTVAAALDALDYTNDVTAFIPNNQAFASIASAVGNMTSADLASVTKYHVVQGAWPNFYLGTNGWTFGLTANLTTLNGKNITITMGNDGTTYVNSAQVVTPNLLVANGIVHVIDNVLNPDNISATPDLSAPTQTPAFAGATTVSGGAVPFTSDVSLPTASNSPANAAGGQGLSAGAKAGIGIGAGIGVLSIIAFTVLLIRHRRKRAASTSERFESDKIPHVSERPVSDELNSSKSARPELDSKSARPELDSHAVLEADSSVLGGHELDSTHVRPELEGRSVPPVELDGRALSPK